MPATTVDEWIDALLSESDPDNLFTISQAALSAGFALEPAECLLCRLPGLTFVGVVRHLRKTEIVWRVEHSEDGPNAALHKPGDVRAIAFGTPSSIATTFWSTSKCKRCPAQVVWADTTAGGRMPVDAEPSPDGTVVLSQQTSPLDPPLATVIRPGEAVPPTSRHTNHMQTCPRPKGNR